MIYLTGEFVWKELERLIKVVGENDRTILISSPGGDLGVGLALYDFIRLKNPVITLGVGVVASAAFLAFLGGDIRLALPNTVFNFHSIYIHFDEAIKELDSRNVIDLAKELNFCNRLVFEIIKERTKITDKDIKDVSRQGQTFGPDRALKLGIINGIVNSLNFSDLEVDLEK